MRFDKTRNCRALGRDFCWQTIEGSLSGSWKRFEVTRGSLQAFLFAETRPSQIRKHKEKTGEASSELHKGAGKCELDFDLVNKISWNSYKSQ